MNWLIHPLETLRNWGVKKYVVGIANTAIAKYNDSITQAREYVAKYIPKVEAVLAYLKSLDAKLADGKIDEDEADAIVDEAKKLSKELVA